LIKVDLFKNALKIENQFCTQKEYIWEGVECDRKEKLSFDGIICSSRYKM